MMCACTSLLEKEWKGNEVPRQCLRSGASPDIEINHYLKCITNGRNTGNTGWNEPIIRPREDTSGKQQEKTVKKGKNKAKKNKDPPGTRYHDQEGREKHSTSERLAPTHNTMVSQVPNKEPLGMSEAV